MSQNVDEGKKDSRTILVRADAEEEQEDTKTQDSRTVVGRQDGEQAGQKTRESQGQTRTLRCYEYIQSFK